MIILYHDNRQKRLEVSKDDFIIIIDDKNTSNKRYKKGTVFKVGDLGFKDAPREIYYFRSTLALHSKPKAEDYL